MHQKLRVYVSIWIMFRPDRVISWKFKTVKRINQSLFSSFFSLIYKDGNYWDINIDSEVFFFLIFIA